jgi:hypothetical protein
MQMRVVKPNPERLRGAVENACEVHIAGVIHGCMLRACEFGCLLSSETLQR